MMKMAKASQEDLDAAMKIVSALEAIEQNHMPEAISADPDFYEEFDIESHRDCTRVIEHLLDLMDAGSLMRVVFGMCVILDPENKCIDPSADTIEHHPERLEAEKIKRQRDELQFDMAESLRIRDALHIELKTALGRLEKAEAELKEMAEQRPFLYVQFSDCGEFIRFWTRSRARMRVQQADVPGSKIVPLYARPIPAATAALHRDAERVLAAWDGTVLPKSHDGRLQEEMEHLRDALGDQLIGEMK